MPTLSNDKAKAISPHTQPSKRSGPSEALSPHSEWWVPVSGLEAFLADYLDSLALPPNLDEALRYALLAGGKRLRPLLVVHCCHAVGGKSDICLPAAAAVEMVHAFSLVHDDLPALDNDDLRRGRPTVHVQFGQAMAVLVGDGLMSLAFQVLADRVNDQALVGRLSGELARGTTRMINGQVLDTLGGLREELADRLKLEAVHTNKTGALIKASCRMGALCGLAERGSDHVSLQAVTDYADAIGLMFQIVDDLLDVEQSTAHTGKRTSKDAEAGKLTYPGLMGIEASRNEIRRLEQVATEALKPLGSNAAALREMCQYLATRTC